MITIIEKYSIKTALNDFKFLSNSINMKGTRTKRLVIDNDGNIAFFKYNGDGYCTSEICSEKMSYEIAKILGYRCAKIELAKDEENTLGILNYVFIKLGEEEHTDAGSYLNISEKERENFYTISNIKRVLDSLDTSLFEEFIKVMVFDALVGEQDRHEDNWGITRIGNNYKFSPLYDNGCNLLNEFKNEEFAEKYYSGPRNFDSFISKSKTYIYTEDTHKRFKHFDLIKFLYKSYPEIVTKEINNLKKLTDGEIEAVVSKIPDDLLTSKHKEYIIIYLKKRRDLLFNIINGVK